MTCLHNTFIIKLFLPFLLCFPVLHLSYFSVTFEAAGCTQRQLAAWNSQHHLADQPYKSVLPRQWPQSGSSREKTQLAPSPSLAQGNCCHGQGCQSHITCADHYTGQANCMSLLAAVPETVPRQGSSEGEFLLQSFRCWLQISDG